MNNVDNNYSFLPYEINKIICEYLTIREIKKDKLLCNELDSSNYNKFIIEKSINDNSTKCDNTSGIVNINKFINDINIQNINGIQLYYYVQEKIDNLKNNLLLGTIKLTDEYIFNEYNTATITTTLNRNTNDEEKIKDILFISRIFLKRDVKALVGFYLWIERNIIDKKINDVYLKNIISNIMYDNKKMTEFMNYIRYRNEDLKRILLESCDCIVNV